MNRTERMVIRNKLKEINKELPALAARTFALRGRVENQRLEKCLGWLLLNCNTIDRPVQEFTIDFEVLVEITHEDLTEGLDKAEAFLATLQDK